MNLRFPQCPDQSPGPSQVGDQEGHRRFRGQLRYDAVPGFAVADDPDDHGPLLEAVEHDVHAETAIHTGDQDAFTGQVTQTRNVIPKRVPRDLPSEPWDRDGGRTMKPSPTALTCRDDGQSGGRSSQLRISIGGALVKRNHAVEDVSNRMFGKQYFRSEIQPSNAESVQGKAG